MKLLHLSDLHIGRRLNGQSLMDDQRHVLEQALDCARDCDAVLLAGDLYDKTQPSSEALKVMGDFLVALSRMKKPVFAVSGNHDNAEQVAYCRELLGATGVFMSPSFDGTLRRHTLEDAYGKVHIYLLPFLRPANVRPFFPEVRGYEDAVRAALSTVRLDKGARNVLVAHQYVGGAALCASETRLIGGIDQISADVFSDFDYVALGHLHSPQRLAGGRVRYCGSPLKYSLSEERQRKAALMVVLEEKGKLSFEERPFLPLHELRTVRGRLSDVAAPERYSEDFVYAELTDEGVLTDPLGVLRLTYPNLVGMRVHNSRTNEEMHELEMADAEALTPLEHFMTFYKGQNNLVPPDERRIAVMRGVIEEAEARLNETDQA